MNTSKIKNPLIALSRSNEHINTIVRYGVSKQIISYVTLNKFTVYENYIDLFKTYYLRKWTSTYTLNKIKNNHLVNEDISYIVIYLGSRESVFSGENVMLSFRAPIDDFNIPAYVLIKKA